MNVEYAYIIKSFLPEITLVVVALGILAVDLLLPRQNRRASLVLIAALGCLLAAGLAGWQWATDTGSVPAFVQHTLSKYPAVPHYLENAQGELPNVRTRLAVGRAYQPGITAASGAPDRQLGLGHPGYAAWWLFANDRFTSAFKVIFAFAGFLVLLFSLRFPVERYRAEFAALLIFAAFGLMVMVNSLDLVVMFLGLELASLCMYALAAWHKGDARSAEAGTKYLLLGSLASAFIIYGASLLFVKFGTTHLMVLIQQVGETGRVMSPIALIGLLMLLVGFGFKVAAAPFHLWAPDVYQGAPTAVTAFLSTASKAAGFAVLLRVLSSAFLPVTAQWVTLIGIMAALSMIIGNLIAIHQNNVKRLLAYSGIAQAGYLLIAVVAFGSGIINNSTNMYFFGIAAIVLYLFLYTVGNIGAFAITGIVTRETGSEEMAAFAGLRTRSPLLAFAMTLILLSLGGIPLLAGFVGKWFLFLSGVYEGQYWLVLLAAALNVVSIYYYLLVIKQIYLLPAPEDARPIRIGASAGFALLLVVLLTLAIGVYPGPFLGIAITTSHSLVGWLIGG